MPLQLSSLEILNTDDRIFKAWGSVEIKDRDNEIIPIDEFKAIMPIIMDRGGSLMDMHSNRPVGKILNYEFKDRKVGNEKLPGLILTCKIFKNYKLDDIIWKGIKSGKKEGLSFGGQNFERVYNRKEDAHELKGLEGFEFSVVDKPANQLATMLAVNMLAKSDKNIKAGDISQIDKKFAELYKLLKLTTEKPFAGFKDFDDCVSQNQNKDDPEAFCAAIMREVEQEESEKGESEKSDSYLSLKENIKNNKGDTMKNKIKKEEDNSEEESKEEDVSEEAEGQEESTEPSEGGEEKTASKKGKKGDEEESVSERVDAIEEAVSDLVEEVKALKEMDDDEEKEEDDEEKDEHTPTEEDKQEDDDEEKEDDDDEEKEDDEDEEKSFKKRISNIEKKLKKLSGVKASIKTRPGTSNFTTKSFIDNVEKGGVIDPLKIAKGEQKINFGRLADMEKEKQEDVITKILG